MSTTKLIFYTAGTGGGPTNATYWLDTTYTRTHGSPSAEMVLLIEYYEVIIPIINAIFLASTYTTISTRYNTKLAMFYNNPDAVYASVQPIMLYSFLQGLSLVVMHFVMRYRYGVSAMYHLAFAIERHGRSIQGKMIAYAPLIFYFTVIHYGMDFSLKFDWTVPDTVTVPAT
ncbi:hypothetical protein Poli38472_000803 [Pythium oligandrum]|uniref:Uncharacterized protein n=1 Tax=Pythium oligandrum TaxID=41045 RepID=A0A8K1CD79_PYTOL|nr:hypothetical protein Poli38472_000803 [Pythium oligandrum]|eukprot:TMW60761.1 hypothetical protein Poli38472_000803 [Pythium oligandrum]